MSFSTIYWTLGGLTMVTSGALRALRLKSPYRVVYKTTETKTVYKTTETKTVYKAVTCLVPEYSTWDRAPKATVASHAVGACMDGLVWPMIWTSLFVKRTDWSVTHTKERSD